MESADRSELAAGGCTAVAFIGLGSNLGDRLAWLCRGRELMQGHAGVELLASSRLYESPPCGGPTGQGDYLNAAVMIRTRLAPLSLLDLCQEIEARCGRLRKERWGERTLDLDLLIYDDLVLRSERLTLPHPRLHQRAFALAPLCDLAPEFLHPLLRRPLRQLAAAPALMPTIRLVNPTPEGW